MNPEVAWIRYVMKDLWAGTQRNGEPTMVERIVIPHLGSYDAKHGL